MITCTRYHDFCYGHRVVGHENACKHLHGHNGRIHFTCQAPELDSVGRITDFSVIKSTLCQWLEDHWDHKMLLWTRDPIANWLLRACATTDKDLDVIEKSIVQVPFNPTAENIATYLLEEIGPRLFQGTNVRLIRVTVEETRKCSATADLER
jgi:6-pyruvoyltetrahydropterin/6-carboxytetrahydropterin synthase